MPPTEITVDECAVMLLEWLRQHCNSDQLKILSNAIGYKYSFFSPQRKLHLLEETTLLYVGLVIGATNMAFSEHATIRSVVDEFLSKLRGKLLNVMAKDDPLFAERYAERMAVYFEHLTARTDPTGVAGDFLSFVFGSSGARLSLDPMVHMAATISAALHSLVQLLEGFEVIDAEALSQETHSK